MVAEMEVHGQVKEAIRRWRWQKGLRMYHHGHQTTGLMFLTMCRGRAVEGDTTNYGVLLEGT